MKTALVGLALSILAISGSVTECPGQTSASPIPNPVLYFVGQEGYSTGGRSFIRYRYDVANSNAYLNEMFAAAPTLPPCGANTRSSRTWVDLFDSRGKRLNGFCALGRSSSLNSIWFAVEEGQVPPSWIYIELSDRQTGLKYKSNLAESTN